MSTHEERREEYKQDAMLDAQDAEKRALWRYCAGTIAYRWFSRHQYLRMKLDLHGREAAIIGALLEALDYGTIPDLDVLIRKTQPDMMAFEESRMTPAERYRQ